MSYLRHSWPVAIFRGLSLSIIFILGCLSIVLTQIVGIFVFKNNATQKQAVINLTKTHFVTLLTCLTSWINPCKISVTYDPASLPITDSFKVDPLGNLSTIFTPNSVVISNHQIYTDWLFIWFLSYTSRLSDSFFIILKDLSNIPVLGYGMKNFNFMFLSRKWENDKVTLTNQLLKIDANSRGFGPANGVTSVASTNVAQSTVQHWPQGLKSNQIWPYQIVIYPEGTVHSPHTKIRSDKFCDKIGVPRLKNCLIPRIRGLYLVLRKLRGSVEVVYDITTGYSDLTADQFGEEVFTLKGFYLLGYGPNQINYHIRAIPIKDIPLGEETVDIDDVKEEDLKEFEKWLFKIWYEKDKLLDTFYKHGQFIDILSDSNNTTEKSKSNTVVADFKLRNQLEIVNPFLSSFILILVIRLIYVGIKKLLLWILY